MSKIIYHWQLQTGYKRLNINDFFELGYYSSMTGVDTLEYEMSLKENKLFKEFSNDFDNFETYDFMDKYFFKSINTFPIYNEYEYSHFPIIEIFKNKKTDLHFIICRLTGIDFGDILCDSTIILCDCTMSTIDFLNNYANFINLYRKQG